MYKRKKQENKGIVMKHKIQSYYDQNKITIKTQPDKTGKSVEF